MTSDTLLKLPVLGFLTCKIGLIGSYQMLYKERLHKCLHLRAYRLGMLLLGSQPSCCKDTGLDNRIMKVPEKGAVVDIPTPTALPPECTHLSDLSYTMCNRGTIQLIPVNPQNYKNKTLLFFTTKIWSDLLATIDN